ncbi:hypothetical protein SCALM49S_08900 [Streptomyces californicus]
MANSAVQDLAADVQLRTVHQRHAVVVAEQRQPLPLDRGQLLAAPLGLSIVPRRLMSFCRSSTRIRPWRPSARRCRAAWPSRRPGRPCGPRRPRSSSRHRWRTSAHAREVSWGTGSRAPAECAQAMVLTGDMATRARVRAPELIGKGGWLNTGDQQYTLADLRGRIVILDFWTFCCVNCLHVLDELRELEEKHRDTVVIIGVQLHEKFVHEAEHQAVVDAVERYKVHHRIRRSPNWPHGSSTVRLADARRDRPRGLCRRPARGRGPRARHREARPGVGGRARGQGDAAPGRRPLRRARAGRHPPALPRQGAAAAGRRRSGLRHHPSPPGGLGRGRRDRTAPLRHRGARTAPTAARTRPGSANRRASPCARTAGSPSRTPSTARSAPSTWPDRGRTANRPPVVAGGDHRDAREVGLAGAATAATAAVAACTESRLSTRGPATRSRARPR